MKKYFKKKFTGTGHVLGNGEAPADGNPPTNQQALLERLEAKKPKKSPPKVSLTEHLKKCEEQRRNAPLQFCEDLPTPPVEEEDGFEEDLELQISVLMSNPEVSNGAVGLLRRVLRNLILNPTEMKYQKLNMTNAKVQEGMVQVPGAVDLLLVCGFVKEEEQLLYKGASSMELPKKGLTLLNRHFPEEVKQTNKTEVLRPETPPVVEVPKRERRTQLLLMRHTETTVPDWFFERTGAEIKAEYFSMIARREQDEKLMTKDQRETLKAPAVQYQFAVVRVRLPEGVLLQGEFDAAESIGRIHEWIAEQLRDMTRPFEIVLPSRARLGLKGTVRDSQLMPATLLSFHWTDGQGMTTQEPTVKDELVTAAVIDWE